MKGDGDIKSTSGKRLVGIVAGKTNPRTQRSEDNRQIPLDTVADQLVKAWYRIDLTIICNVGADSPRSGQRQKGNQMRVQIRVRLSARLTGETTATSTHFGAQFALLISGRHKEKAPPANAATPRGTLNLRVQVGTATAP